MAIAFARALPWDAHAHEVRGWLAQVLAALDAAEPRRHRAMGLYWDGTLALSQGLFGEARVQLGGGAGQRRARGARTLRRGRGARCSGPPGGTGRRLGCRQRCATPRWPRRVGVGDPIPGRRCALDPGRCVRERTQEWERAGELAGEAMELYRAAGDPYGVAWALAEQELVRHGPRAAGRVRAAPRRGARAATAPRRRSAYVVEPLIDHHAWLMLVRGRGAEEGPWVASSTASCSHARLGTNSTSGEALAGLCRRRRHAIPAGQMPHWLAGASAGAPRADRRAPPMGVGDRDRRPRPRRCTRRARAPPTQSHLAEGPPAFRGRRRRAPKEWLSGRRCHHHRALHCSRSAPPVSETSAVCQRGPDLASARHNPQQRSPRRDSSKMIAANAYRIRFASFSRRRHTEPSCPAPTPSSRLSAACWSPTSTVRRPRRSRSTTDTSSPIPLVAPAGLVATLRMRAGAIRAFEATPSLPERLRMALAPARGGAKVVRAPVSREGQAAQESVRVAA